VAVAPEHSPLWEHFRNIDLDKEAKVLQVRACGWVLVIIVVLLPISPEYQ
jgi:hypothetical protein